jgi:ABC-2 type transport system permease protein
MEGLDAPQTQASERRRTGDSLEALSIYAYVLKLRMVTVLAYRWEVFESLVVNIIYILASVFLWRTAYRGIGTVSGVQEDQMITYAISAVVLRTLFQCNVQGKINGLIRRGDIATELLKPVNLIGYWLAEDLGSVLSSLVMYLIPLVVVSTLLIHIPLPASLPALLCFAISCILSFGILWMLGALFGLVTFWTADLGNLGAVKDEVVTILSGSVVPLWFFPDAVQRVSGYLPFQYTYQMPLSIYIGRTKPSEAVSVLLIQSVWIVVLLLLLAGLWRMAKRRTFVQGG